MKLIVFDLDFTLWDAAGTWCDHTFPPYNKVNSHVVDSVGNNIVLFPEVKDILKGLKDKGYKLAIASRTHEPSWAQALLTLFEIDEFFICREIYPGSKITHFKELSGKTGIAYKDMIFFDDEMRNIADVSELGVKAVLVPEGINSMIIRKFI